MYVLIMTVLMHGYTAGGVVATAEFASRDACESAALQWRDTTATAASKEGWSLANIDARDLVATCAPKGDK